ncbi:MAG: hypothetical protein H0V27_03605 [Pyrinomonadaceae bacterium]|nr:hypothetical protein [Pyrinomonadaceae bacterium]
MKEKFLEHIQNRVAETCVGASSLRNQGAGGVLKVVREYFATMPLDMFVAPTEERFLVVLNNETEKLRRLLPQSAQNWGTARKAINLFLRDALYNRYLSEHYGLDRIEAFLEIPLDGDVAGELHDPKGELHNLKGDDLPRWKSIKSLSESESSLYQAKAQRHAQGLGVNRVHLDLIWWRAKK